MSDEERAAFRLTETVLADLKPETSSGWRINFHRDGVVNSRKNGLFSTCELALRALRTAVERAAAKKLAEIDRAIAAEVANPTKEPR